MIPLDKGAEAAEKIADVADKVATTAEKKPWGMMIALCIAVAIASAWFTNSIKSGEVDRAIKDKERSDEIRVRDVDYWKKEAKYWQDKAWEKATEASQKVDSLTQK